MNFATQVGYGFCFGIGLVLANAVMGHLFGIGL